MPRKQNKYYYIYKTICNITGRYYIGMHSTNNLDDGYLGSGKRLWYSINKHGKDNHKLEILEFLDNREKLKMREEELVNENLLQDPMCMNLQLGGGGGFINKEHARKAQQAGAHRCLWLKENDMDWVTKKSKNVSLGNKKSHAEGKRKYDMLNWSGKKHTKDTKKKIGEANAVAQRGTRNSQYGKIWVYSEIKQQSKKINPVELKTHLESGWIRGRKINFNK